jgi:hypothetical protein
MNDEEGVAGSMSSLVEMMQKMGNVSFNAAKLSIEWEQLGHKFVVESMNPVSAFNLMSQTKKVAEQELGKNGRKNSGSKNDKNGSVALEKSR